MSFSSLSSASFYSSEEPSSAKITEGDFLPTAFIASAVVVAAISVSLVEPLSFPGC